MICNHCGLCCVDFDVVIIKPEYAKEDIDIESLTIEGFIHKKGGNPCPHLYWEGEESRCRIHNMSWYDKTPCSDFGQIESSPDCICRLGEYVWEKRRGFYKRYCEEFEKTIMSADEFRSHMFQELKNEKTEHPKT